MVAVEKSLGWLRNSRRTALLFCQRSPDQLSATLHFVVIQKQSQTRGRLANRPPFCCISLFVSRLFTLFATPFSMELLTQRDVLLMKMKKLSIFSLIPPLLPVFYHLYRCCLIAIRLFIFYFLSSSVVFPSTSDVASVLPNGILSFSKMFSPIADIQIHFSSSRV